MKQIIKYSKVMLSFALLMILTILFQLFTFATRLGDDEYRQLFKSKYQIYALEVPKNLCFADETMPLYDAELGDITLNNDSTSSIKLTKYAPMQLDFESNANGNQFAVFSDIYYNKGWNVYVDGVKADYVRVNYLLRGMKIASGKHSIVFKFEPEGYIVGEKIALASSLLLVLLVGFGAFKAVKNS